MKNRKGITLIALIITVIVMLILAGVALSAISGDAGLFSRVQKTAELYNNQVQDEADTVNKIIDMLDEEYMKDINTGANEPDLVEGMKSVIFNDDGTTKEPKTNAEWYNYEEKKWANAKTADGSLWVWIPRFAYKITYYEDADKQKLKGTRDKDGYKNADGIIVTNTGTEPETDIDTIGSQVKSSYGKIDVVFLHETSNQYYKKVDGETILVNAEDDGYIIHPAFKNGNGNYSNGEFNRELTGFWMAKFQAGWQYGENNTEGAKQIDKEHIKRSSVTYTQAEVDVPAVENGTNAFAWKPARNYLDEEYGDNYESTQISFPVFKGNNYAMNYITTGEAYSLAKVLNEDDNPYDFTKKDSDTHLTKNSEWGAVVYLGYSKYGLDGENIHINNKSLNNDVPSVYAVTGWAASSADAQENEGSELWHTETGQKGSTTGNITGVYDMSGCTWEKVTMHIENGHQNLLKFGNSFVTNNDIDKKSTPYVTIYEHNAIYDNSENQKDVTDDKRKIASRNSYKQNDEKYGDAIYETSTSGEYLLTTGFNSDYSSFPHLEALFGLRGGHWGDAVIAGLFAFAYTGAYPINLERFPCSSMPYIALIQFSQKNRNKIRMIYIYLL